MDENKQIELNRCIHEKILGECWHETRWRTEEERKPKRTMLTGTIVGHELPALVTKCIHCPAPIRPYTSNEILKVHGLPDYTSESSPRELLNTVRDRAIAAKGLTTYAVELERLVNGEVSPHALVVQKYGQMLIAPAETIALACAKMFGFEISPEEGWEDVRQTNVSKDLRVRPSVQREIER